MADRAIDHLVLATQDLDAIAGAYRRLGFLVGGRNRHPWGTENHIVQLEDGFLELIGVAADFHPVGQDGAAALFANTLARFIDAREGLAMVALRSADAVEDARHFAAAGIGLGRTHHFSRTAEAADGTRREVAFTTAFALDPEAPTAEFFVCQHHRPENFWNPAMQRHPNGARRLIGIVMTAEQPAERANFLSELFGTDTIAAEESGLAVRAGPHRIDLMTPDRFRAMFGTEPGERWAAYRLGVDSIESVQRFLNVMGSPYAMRDGRLIVPPGVARGVTLSFETLT